MPFIQKKTLTENFRARVEATPHLVGFQYKPTSVDRTKKDHSSAQKNQLDQDTASPWVNVTFLKFYEECKSITYGLLSLGIQPGDKVAILSNTRYEWSLCDMAILCARGVTVPIYASNTPEDTAYILENSESQILLVEDASQLKKILDYKRSHPSALFNLKKIIVFDPNAMTLARQSSPEDPEGFSVSHILTLNALVELGKREMRKDSEKFENLLKDIQSTDVITLCYTSGTTGTPKGTILTHENLISVIDDCLFVLKRHLEPESDVILSFLPFSHIFGKVESLAIYTFGWKQVFAENLEHLMENIEEVRPTLLFSVPRVFEKVYGKIHLTLETQPLLKKLLFQKSLIFSRRYYEPIWKGQRPSFSDTLAYRFVNTFVLSAIRKKLGGRLRFALCGGAPLAQEIGEFFQLAGIRILEGYGLTETSSAITLNTPEHGAFGTVGRPLPDVQFKLAADGELCVQSKKVFQGYHRMPEESAQVLQEGWFHTGDIGYIDSQGLVHITDRKKDLIVTSGGKKIAPQKIENIAKSYDWISHLIVYGDRRNYLTALVVLDRERVIQYARKHHLELNHYEDLLKNTRVCALAQKIIDQMNMKLAHFETIKKFVLLSRDFTIESGELTPSLKMRRNVIYQHYHVELDGMYEQPIGVPA